MEWLIRDVLEDWQLDDPAEALEIFPRVRDEVKAKAEKRLAALG